MDPEAWSQIMQRFLTILADGVERFGGFVDKFTGDDLRMEHTAQGHTVGLAQRM